MITAGRANCTWIRRRAIADLGVHPGAVPDGVVRSKHFVTEPVDDGGGRGAASGGA